MPTYIHCDRLLVRLIPASGWGLSCLIYIPYRIVAYSHNTILIITMTKWNLISRQTGRLSLLFQKYECSEIKSQEELSTWLYADCWKFRTWSLRDFVCVCKCFAINLVGLCNQGLDLQIKKEEYMTKENG